MKDVLGALASVAAWAIVEESRNYAFGIHDVNSIWKEKLELAIRNELKEREDVQEGEEENKNTE